MKSNRSCPASVFRSTTLAAGIIVLLTAAPGLAQTGAQPAPPKAVTAPQVVVPPIVVDVPPVTVQLPDRKLFEEVQAAVARAQETVRPEILELQALKAATAVDTLRPEMLALEAQLEASRWALDFQQGRVVTTGQGSGRGFSTLVYSSESGSYDAGLSMLDAEHWQRAIEQFDRVIKAGKTRVDGALYWKAYALDRLGERNEALSTLQELQKSYPGSRWLNDAKALEIEVRQHAGQPVKPEDHADEDLKLLAINSLMQTDPDRAVPMLQQVIKGRNSLKVKERALFVLAQNNSPQARNAVAEIARGGANPDLQMKAVRYLGMGSRGRDEANAQLLADLYASTSDVDIKREIIRTLGSARDVDRLMQIAKTEQSSELRGEAIRYLGNLSRGSTFYAVTADRATLLSPRRPLAQTEARNVDPKAIADALVQMYKTEKDPSVKKQIISTLHSQQNAKAMVDLARAESDLTMKREIVSRLATMKSKEATDYMLEILK